MGATCPAQKHTPPAGCSCRSVTLSWACRVLQKVYLQLLPQQGHTALHILQAAHCRAHHHMGHYATCSTRVGLCVFGHTKPGLPACRLTRRPVHAGTLLECRAAEARPCTGILKQNELSRAVHSCIVPMPACLMVTQLPRSARAQARHIGLSQRLGNRPHCQSCCGYLQGLQCRHCQLAE